MALVYNIKISILRIPGFPWLNVDKAPMKNGHRAPFLRSIMLEQHWILNAFRKEVDLSSYGRGRWELINQQKKTKVLPLGHSLPLFTACNFLTKSWLFCLVVSFQERDTRWEHITSGRAKNISRKPYFGSKREWDKELGPHFPGRLKSQEWWWGRGHEDNSHSGILGALISPVVCHCTAICVGSSSQSNFVLQKSK